MQRARLGDVVVCLMVACLLALAQGASANPVIYQEDFSGPNGTQPVGFNNPNSPHWAQYANVKGQILGGEYEQRKTAVHPTPSVDDDSRVINYYNDADAIDTGAWRDTTISTIVRFNPECETGLVFRGRDIVRGSGDLIRGDFYHARISGSTLELMRFRGNDVGSNEPTPLATDAGSAFSTTVNRLLRVQVANVPHLAQDHVEIQVDLFSGTTEASSILRSITYTDTSSAAITRSGGVGFRTLNRQPVASKRSVFDDLTVVNDNPALLWYDDYFDNKAPRMVPYAAGSVTVGVTNKKYGFNGSGPADAGALLDFDSFTQQPEWENVSASALMRMGLTMDGLYSGLIVRAQGMDLTTGAGHFYTFNLTANNGGEAGLYRYDDGAITDLNILDIAGVPASTNMFVKVDALSTADGVLLTGVASLSPDFSNPFAIITALDDSAGAIYGPGTVGFAVMNQLTSSATFAANFDNFTVMAIPEPGTLSLLGIGGLGALVRRRRRR